jgi:hypothetical protein
MAVATGDLITVRGFGPTARRGTVVEARKGIERDLLLVRWEDGHTSLFIPGASTTVDHPAHDGNRRANSDGPRWIR